MNTLTQQEFDYWMGNEPNWYTSSPKSYVFMDNDGHACTVIGATSYEQAKALFDKTNPVKA